MRLNLLAASALAAGVSASNALVERELAARDLVNVGPGGSTCPPIPTTVIVLQPIFVPNATTTSFITTTTTVFPGGSTTTVSFPPFTIGQGLPSGSVTNLPFEQFLFLAYQTPTAAPIAKRDNELEARQVRVQATASPIKLVDVSVPSPGAPALPAVNCDGATPLNLVNGVLNGVVNGNGFSLGKLLTSTDAVLGALINPPDNQVNLTFSIQNGLLQWNSPDAGFASFYSCSNTIYAGFPNLQISGCTQVRVGPIAGAVCIQYVTSTRSVNPDFTQPLTSTTGSATSTSTAAATTTTGGAAATTTGGSGSQDSGSSSTGTGQGTGSGDSGSASSTTGTGQGTGSGDSGSASSTTGTGQGTGSGDSGSASSTTSDDSGSASSTTSGDSGSASSTTSGDSGSASSTTSGSSGFASSTTSGTGLTSSVTSAPATTTSPGSCLIQIPQVCFGLQGLAAGVPQLLTTATDCLAAIQAPGFLSTPGLDVSGTVNAAVCLTTGLTSSGNTILTCLQQNLICSSGSGSTSTTSAGQCLVQIPQACLAIQGLPALDPTLLTSVTACLAAIQDPSFLATPGINIAGAVNAVGCLANGALSSGNTIFGCLQANLLCSSGSSTTSAITSSTSAASLLNCVPSGSFNQCAALNGLTLLSNPSAAVQAVACLTQLTGLITSQLTNPTLSPSLIASLTTATTGVASCFLGAVVNGNSVLTCLANAGIVPC